jgi:tetratricopeptide (TPR) repeat protein
MENSQNSHDNEFYQKAVSLYKKKNFDYAIELFKGILEKDPDFEQCRFYLWDAIRQKNTNNKPSILTAVIKKIKTGLMSLKFYFLDITKKDTEALNLIRRIILIDPSNVSAFFKLAHLYLRSKQNEKAIKVLEQVLIIDKTNLPALKILASTYYSNKSYNKARLIATKVLEISPHYLPAENILKDISALGTIEKGFDEMKPAT